MAVFGARLKVSNLTASKNVIRAITKMEVEIQNESLADFLSFFELSQGNCYIVEKAEPPRMTSTSMMAGVVLYRRAIR